MWFNKRKGGGKIYGVPRPGFRTGGQTLFWFGKERGQILLSVPEKGGKYFSSLFEKGGKEFFRFSVFGGGKNFF